MAEIFIKNDLPSLVKKAKKQMDEVMTEEEKRSLDIAIKQRPDIPFNVEEKEENHPEFLEQRIKDNPIDTTIEEKEEKVPFPCPQCGQDTLFQTKTKRTFAWKCRNCGFDTNKLVDVFGHRGRELEVLPRLKKMFPVLTFVENTPIDTNFITGEKGSGRTKYDFKVFFLGKKLARCKVTVCRNTTRDKYLSAEENYIQGRQEVFDYLSKIDTVFIWYFPDEPDESKKIAMAKCRDIAKFAIEVEDRFKNKQYSIPVGIRKIIIKTEFKDFKDMMFGKFYDIMTEGVYVV